MDSILTSIKKMLGISEENVLFDPEIIIHINSVFTILNQLGIGPNGFFINDKTATWNDFFQDETNKKLVESYMYMRVRLLFDSQLSSALIDTYKSQIAEDEWRLNVLAENERAENG